MMDRPDEYPSRKELVKDLLIFDDSFSKKEIDEAKKVNLEPQDLLVLKAAAKGNGNIFNAYLDVIKNGYKAVNKSFSGSGGSPYFLSVHEYLNIIRPVNGVLPRLGYNPPDCKLRYPHQIGSHARTGALSHTNVVTCNTIHCAPLAADLLLNIHPVLLKQTESFISSVKALSYAALPSTHYGSFQQAIHLMSEAKGTYMAFLADCFKGLQELCSDYAGLNSLIKNRVQHLSLSQIEGSVRSGIVTGIKDQSEAYFKDVQTQEALIKNVLEKNSFSTSYINGIISGISSGQFYNNPIKRGAGNLGEASGIVESVFAAATQSIFYPGTGWVDDLYGEAYKSGIVSKSPSGDGAAVTRMAHVKADTSNFVASQPPNDCPAVVGPPRGDINLNPFFVKKSSKRTFVEDYKERIPEMPDHLLVGGDAEGEQN